jgi:2-keto-4-pentenoate hydratase/2-oxohepta-3-ene-1,7-dioic acid hydratase in catechol pathway
MFAPTKIVAVGLNYRDHARELDMPVPEVPLIIYPALTQELHYEGELAIVVGKRARHVPLAEASRHIAGYTCANDVTARDLQRLDGQWTRSKSFDTFCPLGPRIVPDIDAGNLFIETRVNGEVKQRSNTINMIFDPLALLSYISSIMTLLEGDIIITGTPFGVGPLEVGDVVEVEIEDIGVLRNHVGKE